MPADILRGPEEEKVILAPEPTQVPFSPGFFAVVPESCRVTLLMSTAPWSLTYQPKYSY